MTITPETRGLAAQLLACEANTGMNAEAIEPATLRVYEKMRGNLCVLAGEAGFQSLSSRALALASLQVSGFRAIRVAPDGRLQGVGETEPRMNAEIWTDENGVILISSLLGLLLMFLGEALTMSLIQNVWPDAPFDNCNPRNGRKA